MDPDDMYLNANLFKELIQYNEKNNLDINIQHSLTYIYFGII